MQIRDLAQHTPWRGLFAPLVLLVLMSFLDVAQASEERTLSLSEGAYGKMTVPVTINGQETDALIDTGATIPLIHAALLEQTKDTLTDLPQASILGIGGSREYPLLEVTEITIGDDRWFNLTVAVNNANVQPVRQPILPANLFKTRVIDFDFANQKVHLYDERPRYVRNARRSKLKYDTVNELPFVTVSINGVKGRALIDTGADITFANKAFAKAARSKIDEEQTKRIRGSDLSKNTAEIHSLRNFVVGQNKVAKVSMPIVETELFTTLGVGEEYCMVIGMDFLKFFRLQIDREKQEIRLAHITAGKASYVKRGNPAMTLRSLERR